MNTYVQRIEIAAKVNSMVEGLIQNQSSVKNRRESASLRDVYNSLVVF